MERKDALAVAPSTPTGRPSPNVSALAIVSAAIGPAAAALHEAGSLRIFPGEPLGDVWLVAAAAAVGAGVGILAFKHGARLSGIFAVVSNAIVLALYGFLAAFFSFGGSR